MTHLHPILERASRGKLPAWAEAGKKRRKHMGRVAGLMEAWARKRAPGQEARWTAAAWLHDALKDAAPDALRKIVPHRQRDFPDPLLHGPAVAARLREEGVEDEPLLLAVEYHTLGHPRLDMLGRALYCADFLEPARRFRKKWRAGLRERMPGGLEEVLEEILRGRIGHLLDASRPVRPETMAFWNGLVEGDDWARASEV